MVKFEAEIVKDLESLKRQHSTEIDETAEFSYIDETVRIRDKALVLYEKTTDGSTLIWDSPFYGMWDSEVYLWAGDGIMDGYATSTLKRIVSPNDTFYEEFLDEAFKE